LPPTSTVDDINRYRAELDALAKSVTITAAGVVAVAGN
jgi:hypothetical protein